MVIRIMKQVTNGDKFMVSKKDPGEQSEQIPQLAEMNLDW